MIGLRAQVGGRLGIAKLINPLVLLLPLHNYSMAYHDITLPKVRYPTDRQDYGREETFSIPPYGPLLAEPRGGYFEKFRLDAVLLKEALSPYAGRRDATLAEQVFGSQARQGRISLAHLANILHERALLHRTRLRDINHRLVDCQDRLSVLKMNSLGESKAQQHLEKLILELESQQHEEEINFWKDSTEIRQQLFENAATYGQAKHRQDMVEGVEADGI